MTGINGPAVLAQAFLLVREAGANLNPHSEPADPMLQVLRAKGVRSQTLRLAEGNCPA